MVSDEKSTPIMLRVSPVQLKALDNWRRGQEDLPGRPEAVRRLIDAALAAKPAKKSR